MIIFIVVLYVMNLVEYGQLFHQNDEEVLSDIKFLNKSYIELQLISNKSINVWLKPYSFEETTNENTFDKMCVFTAQLTGKDVRGTAILSVCGQRMTGVLDFNGIYYSLNSLNFWNSSNLTTNKDLSRSKRSLLSNILPLNRNMRDDSAICGNIFWDQANVENRAPKKIRSFQKGKDEPNIKFGTATIKLAVFVDQMLFKHRFDDDMTEVKEFVAINIAYLQKQLHQKNILRHIHFKIVVVHFSVAPFYDTHLWYAGTYLSKFCRWVKYNTTYYSDVNILFTGSQLWWIKEGQISTTIRGLSYVGQLCGRRFSCILLEGRLGFTSVRVLIHEFGHILGAEHDGQKELQTEQCDAHSFIMSPLIANGKNTWSKCTIKYIRLYLLSIKRGTNKTHNWTKCFQQTAKPMDILLDVTLSKYKRPGLRTSANQQCQHIFGPKFTYSFRDRHNICMRMQCMDDFYTYTTFGALEGTECGPNRKCDNDRCRRMPLGDFNKYVKLGMPNLRYLQNVYVQN